MQEVRRGRSSRGPKKKRIGEISFVLWVLLSPCALRTAQAQEYAATAVSRHVLTNDGIVALARAGFDEYFIAERIRTSRSKLDASVQGLISLKEAGVSEDLIREVAMQDRRNFLAERWSYTAPPETAPAGTAKVMVEKHWWGFHWVRVSP